MANNSTRINIRSQYKVLFTLGHGTFGTVKLACHLKTEALVAVKTIEVNKKTIQGILREVTALEALQHPHIISLFQVMVTPGHVSVITEYIPGGNLFEIIKEDGPMQEEEARKIFGQVVSAVKHCHSLHMVHRDIKPHNVLRDEDGNVKLIDFGLATNCRPGTLLRRQCGTKSCFPPELVLGEPYDGKKADVWSLGVLLYFITTGHYPFKGSTMKELEEKVSLGTYNLPTHVSGQLENLIHQILTVSPEMRPTIDDIEKHPWVMKCEVQNPTETDPDYNIVDMLCDMGFNASDVLDSLKRKRYNESMGAYLILKAQVDKGLENAATISDKPVDRCPTPPPTPAQPLIYPLPLKRRDSEPSFSLLHIQPSGEHRPVAPALSGNKVARCISMPSIALHCPAKKSRTSTCAPHSGAVAAPCVCSSILEDELSVPPDQECDIETPPPPRKIGRFKKFTKRIRDCLSQLCCFPRAPKTKEKHTSSRKVAPLKEAGGRTQ